MMNSNAALDQIKARAEGRTEGPWELAGGGEWLSPWGIDVGSEDSSSCPTIRSADAELFVAAPKLLAALEAVELLANDLIDKNQESTSPVSWGLLIAGQKVSRAIEEALR